MKFQNTIYEFLTIFFKNKWIVLITLVSTLSIVSWNIYHTIPLFESNLTILVKFGREYIYQNVAADTRSPSNYFNRDGIINNEIEILTSDNLIKDLIQGYGLKNLYPLSDPEQEDSVDQMINQFRESYSVKGVSDSDLIRISFTHENPQTSYQIINRLVDTYKSHHIKTFSNANTTPILSAKVDEYREKLNKSYEDLKRLKSTNSTYLYDSEISLLVNKRASLENLTKDSENKIAALENRLNFINSQKNLINENIEIQKEPSLLSHRNKEKLLNLEIEKQNLLKKYRPNHPKIVLINKEIASVKTYLQSANSQPNVTIGRNEIYAELERDLIHTEANIQSHKITYAAASRELSDVESRLQALSAREKEFNDLKRDIQEFEKKYQLALNKLEQAQLSDEMDQQRLTNIRIVQAPTLPTTSTGGHKKIKLIIGLILGTAAGFGLAFIIEEITQSLNTPTAAEKRLGLPVLTSIAHKPNLNQLPAQ